MAEKSIYESAHPTRAAQNNAFCFGKIISVDTAKRMCTVSTFFATDPRLNDLRIKNCQWLNMDASTDGDEGTSVPRRNSIGIVLFIQNEPFIFGYFKALNKSKQAVTGKEVTPLAEGDKVFSTRTGNYIAIKSSGLIEIKGKETLRSIWLPTRSQWINLCRNFELKTDGGVWNWGSDTEGNTVSKQIFRKDLANSMVVIEERGNADGGVIYRTGIGPGAAAGAVFFYEQTIGLDGTVTTKVGPSEALITQTITPDGGFSIEGTTDITLHTKAGHVQITADALDVAILATAGNVDVEATAGDLALNGSQGKLKLSKGQVGLGGPKAELLDLLSQTLKALSDTLAAIGQQTHISAFPGFPSGPPINLPAFAKAQADVVEITTLLGTITGGI